jgi:hypothetical protein
MKVGDLVQYKDNPNMQFILLGVVLDLRERKDLNNVVRSHARVQWINKHKRVDWVSVHYMEVVE